MPDSYDPAIEIEIIFPFSLSLFLYKVYMYSFRSCDSENTYEILEHFLFTFEHGVPTRTGTISLVHDSGIILPKIV